MRVLFIGSGIHPSTFIQRRLDFLNDEGVECLLHAEHRLNKDSSLWKVIKLFLLKPKRIYFLFKIISLQRGTNFRLKLKKAIKYIDFIEVKPEIIHFQWIDYVHTFSWLINYFKVPVVASVRGSMVTVYPNDNPEYINKLDVSFGLTDYVHCVSDSLKNICIEKFNVNKNKVFTNYNGIDVSKFRPIDFSEKEASTFTLITVGSLMWRKGILFQLLVMNELKDFPIKLVCIGKGEDEFKLKYQIKKLGLTDRVSLVGEKNEVEIIN
ncbi:MAG: glycosyltransferase, partial [Flavobacteriaceae bacterium]|nr:glycosyltransferase [Flavobacteriaceae bacterium]